jgi:hypothetical protein
MLVPPSATEKNTSTEQIEYGTAPVTDHLPDFSLVVDRVCILLLAALAVFVPTLTGRQAQSFLSIISGMIIGVSCALPTTMCVLKADGSAHTKWFLGEILNIFAGSFVFIFTFGNESDEVINVRWVAYSVVAFSIAIPSVRTMCRRDSAPGDRKRVALILLTGLGQVLFYMFEFINSFNALDERDTRNSSFWSIGVVACAAFVVMLFWMDRNEEIKHSVPYAMAYAWALSASVLGASYILGLFYRFDTLINSVFGLSSTLVSQVSLTLFSTLVVWVFGQVSGRITTERDRTAFMFPGLFAVEMFQCMLFAGVAVAQWNFFLLLFVQESFSAFRNVGVAPLLWYRLQLKMGRKTVHPFESREAIEKIVHYACVDSLAEVLGTLSVFGVVAIETLLLGIFGRGVKNCSFSRCGESRVYDWEEAQPLVLFGVVLGVRVMFLLGERALLLHMITKYQRIVMTHCTHTTRTEDQVSGGGKVVEFSIDFRREVREILGGDASGTIHILIVSVLIQTLHWFSEFKVTPGYTPYFFQAIE